MNKNRVLWHSRRGMLELDLLLEPFARERYGELSEAQQRDYQALLRCEDQHLFSLLLQREVATDDRLVDIIQEVLAFAAAKKR